MSSLRMVTAMAVRAVIGAVSMSPRMGSTARGGSRASKRIRKPGIALPAQTPSHSAQGRKVRRITSFVGVQPPGASAWTISATRPAVVAARRAKKIRRGRIIGTAYQGDRRRSRPADKARAARIT